MPPPPRTPSLAAGRPAWWIIAGCGAAVLLLGAVTTGRWARATADRTAALFEDEAQGTGRRMRGLRQAGVLFRRPAPRSAASAGPSVLSAPRPYGHTAASAAGSAASCSSRSRDFSSTGV